MTKKATVDFLGYVQAMLKAGFSVHVRHVDGETEIVLYHYESDYTVRGRGGSVPLALDRLSQETNFNARLLFEPSGEP